LETHLYGRGKKLLKTLKHILAGEARNSFKLKNSVLREKRHYLKLGYISPSINQEPLSLWMLPDERQKKL
jgi:hypothetical protein